MVVILGVPQEVTEWKDARQKEKCLSSDHSMAVCAGGSERKRKFESWHLNR